ARPWESHTPGRARDRRGAAAHRLGSGRASSDEPWDSVPFAREERSRILRMEVAPTEPVDVPREPNLTAVERGGDLCVKRRRPARRIRAVEHDHLVDTLDRRRERRVREGAKRRDLDEPD